MATESSEQDTYNSPQGSDSFFACYEESRFVDRQINEEFKCPIGFGVLNNPKQTPCNHVICYGCILKTTIESPSSTIPFPSDILRCPICRKEFTKTELADVSFNFKNLLIQKRIKCFFPQCKTDVALDDILFHENTCIWNPNREVNCTDCNKRLRASDKGNHYCEQAVARKFEDLSKLKQDINQELEKQEEILKKMLQ